MNQIDSVPLPNHILPVLDMSYIRPELGSKARAVQSVFGSLELGIWILFVICYLVLGI